MKAEQHSKNFIRVKKLYFEEKKKIKAVKLNFGGDSTNAKITFEDNGSDIVVSGPEGDLFDLATKFNSTIRNGEKEIVDISTTPAQDSNTYYENIDYFVPRGFKDIKEVSKKFYDGSAKINPSTNIHQAVEDILDNKFETSDAKEVINNYFEAISLFILKLKPIHEVYEQVKAKQTKNLPRFKAYMSASDKIFKESFENISILETIMLLKNNCTVDIRHLLTNFSTTIVNISRRWDKFYKVTGGKLEGEDAMQYIVSDYEKIFEIAKEIIIDFAIMLKTEEDEFDYNSEYQVISFLKRKGFSHLVGTIDNDLRNGSAHSSIDYTTEKGIIRIYDSNRKDRKLIKKLTYAEVLKKYDSLVDLAYAVLFSYLLNREVYYLKALDSPDFKFHVVENKPPESKK